LVFHRDVTERKRAEKKLCESEKKYKELVELLPEMVFELDTAGRVIFANQAAFRIFGYSERDLGVSAIQMFVPQDRERAKKNIMGVLSGEKLGVTEYTALRKDGSTFPVIIHSTPIIRENKPVGLRGIIVDITERKLAEEERLKREKVFRMGEDITGSIIKKFGVGITSEELGLNDILSQFSELAVYPSPLNLFNLLTAGTSVVLRREGVDARKKEVREFLAPLVQKTLKEIFVIAEEFKRDIPSEYKDFEKTLETMCS
ncbi:MAG: PAS domain-containing protein, partial [Candidatus Hadarchaeaceae archaeon]